MAPDRRIVMTAPAKVNLYLGVGAKRPDGYHEVETVLQTIALADTVTLRSSRGLSLSGGDALDIPAEKNLAFRAAAALAHRLDRSADVHLTLTKRIPAGAGLGGASSDAAAVLAGLGRLWDIGIEQDVILLEVAASLGADVPFFLAGGTALYGARGDVLIGKLPSPSLEIVVVKPPRPVPTAQAYEVFDRLGGPESPGPESVAAACAARDAARVARELHNDMTGAAIALVPEIAEVFTLCHAVPGVLGCALAGSGSAVFAVCESSGVAAQIAARAEEDGFWSCATRSTDAGVHVV